MLRFSQLKLLRAIVCLSSGQPTVKKRTQIRCYRASGVCFLPITVFLEVCRLLCRVCSYVRTTRPRAVVVWLQQKRPTHHTEYRCVPTNTHTHAHTRSYTLIE
uniref:Putative secreted protein n=1 Tax=Anopheles marajoara TaxID=58244 RepID=A0A2M4C8E3_9DIPT